MTRLFKLKRTAPLEELTQSREGCTYLFRTMKYIGWIPPQRGRMRMAYLIASALQFGLSRIYSVIGLSLSFIFEFNELSAEQLAGIFLYVINISGNIVKSTIMMLSLSSLHEARSALDILDESITNDDDRLKIQEAVAKCKTVFLAYLAYYWSYPTSMLITALKIGEPTWHVYIPFLDWRQSTSALWLQNLLEFSTMLITLTVCLVIDTCQIMFFIMFRGHVEVLKGQIRNLRTDPNKTEAENYLALVGCIKYYNQINSCCQLVRPIFSRTIFIQFMLIGAVVGLTMVALMFSADIYFRISLLILLIGLLLQTFPSCYLYDLLANDSDDLSNLLAQSHWLGAEPRYKSTLMIFMHQVQQPILFVAFGIILISLNTNIKVAKFAWTVLTVVSSLHMFDKFK